MNVPQALKFNMNNVCIFCYILYKILAVSPSFRAFNHGPPGVLWDTCSLKPSEEPERVGTAGKKENLTADLLHSARMPSLFKRQLEEHYADRTPIERYGKAATTSEYTWSFVCVNLTLQFSLLDVWMQFFPLARGEIWSSMWTTPFCFWKKAYNIIYFEWKILDRSKLKVKRIVQWNPTDENSVIIYTHLCCSRPTWLYFFWIQC